MPDINTGLTFAADEHSRAPEAPLDADQQKHDAIIHEQSRVSRETPSDDGFSKEEIVAAFNEPTGIAAGLRTPGDAQDHAERMEQFSRESAEWLDSPEGQAHQREQAEIERGKSLIRLHDVVLPAYEVLSESFDTEERAAAWATLSPTEKQNALQQGYVDEEESDDLVALGAQILNTRQQAHAAMSGVLADTAAATDRSERWESIKSDFGLTNNPDADQLLMEAVARTQEAGAHLGSLPGPAWEAAVRHTAGALLAEHHAVAHANEKNEIVRAESASISEGLTEQGRPLVTPPVFQPKPNYALADLLASGRTKPQTDDEIRDSVRYAHTDTSVEHNVVEGGEQIPASTQAKMAALFGR